MTDISKVVQSLQQLERRVKQLELIEIPEAIPHIAWGTFSAASLIQNGTLTVSSTAYAQYNFINGTVMMDCHYTILTTGTSGCRIEFWPGLDTALRPAYAPQDSSLGVFHYKDVSGSQYTGEVVILGAALFGFKVAGYADNYLGISPPLATGAGDQVTFRLFYRSKEADGSL